MAENDEGREAFLKQMAPWDIGGATPFATDAANLFPPLGRRLRIPRRGPSSRLMRKECEANLAGSFEKASRLLKTLAKLDIGAKQAELVTGRVGEALRQEREAATEAFLDGKPAACAKGAPELLVVSADGGRVQTRQEDRSKKWKEDKLGVVYGAAPSPERPGERYAGPPPITRSLTGPVGRPRRFPQRHG